MKRVRDNCRRPTVVMAGHWQEGPNRLRKRQVQRYDPVAVMVQVSLSPDPLPEGARNAAKSSPLTETVPVHTPKTEEDELKIRHDCHRPGDRPVYVCVNTAACSYSRGGELSPLRQRAEKVAVQRRGAVDRENDPASGTCRSVAPARSASMEPFALGPRGERRWGGRT